MGLRLAGLGHRRGLPRDCECQEPAVVSQDPAAVDEFIGHLVDLVFGDLLTEQARATIGLRQKGLAFGQFGLQVG